MKNILTGTILGIIIAMWVVYFYRQDKLPFIKKPQIVLAPTPTSSVPIFPSATLSPTKTITDQKSDTDTIKQLFANKYHRKVTDVELTTKYYDSSHFVGSCSFKLAMAGGILLAAKNKSQEWVLVQDGNGSIMCDAVSPYSFPVNMVPECVNKKGVLVKL